jgi:hypothetical protein
LDLNLSTLKALSGLAIDIGGSAAGTIVGLVMVMISFLVGAVAFKTKVTIAGHFFPR